MTTGVSPTTGSAAEWDRLAEALEAFELVETSAEHLRRSRRLQRQLASKHQSGRKLPDLLVAAAAEAASLTVLRYDADFDRIAAVTSQSCSWIVPAGSVAERACAWRKSSTPERCVPYHHLSGRSRAPSPPSRAHSAISSVEGTRSFCSRCDSARDGHQSAHQPGGIGVIETLVEDQRLPGGHDCRPTNGARPIVRSRRT